MWLCQSCLRVIQNGSHDSPCVCGGDMCNCKGCARTAYLLMEGVTDWIELGILSPIESWTATEGLKR